MSTGRRVNRSGRRLGGLMLASALLALGGCPSGNGGGDPEDGGRRDGEAGPAEDGGRDAAELDGSTDAEAESDAAPSERRLCIQTCVAGPDCLPPSVCEDRRCVMVESEQACTVDRDCVPFASFWEIGTACTAGGSECSSIEACVDVSGRGYCVRKPTAPDTCTARGLVEVEWPGIDGGTVTVCGRTSGVCDDELCVSGCSRDSDCTTSSRPLCDVAARRCVCSPSSCGAANAGGLCLASGQCGCATDADCPGPGFDRCYGEQCGCSDVASCEEMLEGYSLVCEPLGG